MTLRELIDALTLVPDEYLDLEVVYWLKERDDFLPFNEISVIEKLASQTGEPFLGPVVALHKFSSIIHVLQNVPRET